MRLEVIETTRVENEGLEPGNTKSISVGPLPSKTSITNSGLDRNGFSTRGRRVRHVHTHHSYRQYVPLVPPGPLPEEKVPAVSPHEEVQRVEAPLDESESEYRRQDLGIEVNPEALELQEPVHPGKSPAVHEDYRLEGEVELVDSHPLPSSPREDADESPNPFGTFPRTSQKSQVVYSGVHGKTFPLTPSSLPFCFQCTIVPSLVLS